MILALVNSVPCCSLPKIYMSSLHAYYKFFLTVYVLAPKLHHIIMQSRRVVRFVLNVKIIELKKTERYVLIMIAPNLMGVALFIP